MDLSQFQGIGIFGPAYRTMLENDAHAPGSVEMVLVDQMILLCPQTAEWLYSEFTPTTLAYAPGSLPALESHARRATAEAQSDEEKIAAIAGFCAALDQRAPTGLDEMRAGGTEEQIIERGSDWCTDVARVGCALCQVTGVPARIVCLADTQQAYSGHVIIEAHRGGRWGATDMVANVVYRRPDRIPATVWDLLNHPEWITAAGSGSIYARPSQFRRAAIANYLVQNRSRYDYTVTGLNDYYRSILTMSDKGWPGGLRWLHGEDRS